MTVERRRHDPAAHRAEVVWSILDASAAQVAILDPGGTIVACNRAWRDSSTGDPTHPRRMVENDPYLARCADGTSGEPEAVRVVSAVRAVLSGAERESVEYTIDVGGERRWFVCHVTGAAVDGVRHAVVAREEVTDRRRAEEALRETTERLQALVDSSPVAIVAMEVDGTVRSWNRAAERIFGWSPEEAIGRFLPFVAPDQRRQFRGLRDRVVAGETVLEVELSRRRKDGTTVDVSMSSARLTDPNGRVTGVMAVLLDVSIRTRALRDLQEHRQQLAEAEERYRTLVEQMPVVTYVWEGPSNTSKTLAAYLSPQIEGLLGYRPEELFAQPGSWTDLIHPDDLPRVVAAQERFETDGEPLSIEYRMLALDGRIVWVQDNATVLSRDQEAGTIRIQGVLHDITERKEAEEALRLAEERYRTLVEQIPAITYMDQVTEDDPTDVVPIYISPQVGSVLGYSPEEWLEDEYLWERLVHPDDRDAVSRAGDRARLEGEPFAAEYRMIARDGREVWIQEDSVLIRDADGEPRFWQGIMQDVTERKQAEEALRLAEEKFRTLVEQIEAVAFVDDTGDHGALYVSPQIATLLRCPADAWRTDPDFWWKRIHPDDAARVREEWDRVVAARRPYRDEYRMVRDDGRVIWVAERSVIHEEAGRGALIVGVVFDITDRRESEDMLRQSEEGLQRSLEVLQRTERERRKLLAHLLASEGTERSRLAEGIEDESLQHITAVGVRLESLRRRLSDPEQLGAVDKLGDTVAQATNRLKHLLVELRPRALEQEGLGAALRQYARMAAEDAPVAVVVDDRRAAPEPSPGIRMLGYRIARDLISNALAYADASRVDVTLEDRDDGVLVLVRDDGKGFTDVEDAGQELFDLAAVRERAELGGGWLKVAGAPGQGTRVEFWLPGGAAATDP
ncbi:MAG TPA: PAS domain S-box protein [Actinomycetota bacterium]